MSVVDDVRQISQELKESFGTLRKNESTASIQINGGGLVAVIVGIIGAISIVVALASVIVVAIWRDADLRDMSQLRAKQRELEAYSTVHEKRLNKLESENVPTRR